MGIVLPVLLLKTHTHTNAGTVNCHVTGFQLAGTAAASYCDSSIQSTAATGPCQDPVAVAVVPGVVAAAAAGAPRCLAV